MIKRVIEKLKSGSGESIAETLVALLISALALMMLAGAVSAGMNMVTRSNRVMEEYYTGINEIVERDKKSDTYMGQLTLKTTGLNASGTAKVISWKNDELGSTPVIVYTYDPSED